MNCAVTFNLLIHKVGKRNKYGEKYTKLLSIPIHRMKRPVLFKVEELINESNFLSRIICGKQTIGVGDPPEDSSTGTFKAYTLLKQIKSIKIYLLMDWKEIKGGRK